MPGQLGSLLTRYWRESEPGVLHVDTIARCPPLHRRTPLSCSGRTESAAFSRWADSASYFRVSNGGFESGSTDWALSGGAGVVAGSETYKVAGSGDVWSLKVPAGATAESRSLCVSRGEDTIRLFANNSGVAGAILHVEATVRNPTTGQVAQTAFEVNADAARQAGLNISSRLLSLANIVQTGTSSR